jgi:hypothetical protein
MTLTYTDLANGKITLFDSSFALRQWETGDDTISRKGDWFAFDFEKEGVKSSFDVTFDLDGTCKWAIEKGDFIEPDFIEQSDVDIIIDIKEFWSEEIEVDLTTEVKNLLIEKIKTQLYEF